jgi:hypothetical protein
MMRTTPYTQARLVYALISLLLPGIGYAMEHASIEPPAQTSVGSGTGRHSALIQPAQESEISSRLMSCRDTREGNCPRKASKFHEQHAAVNDTKLDAMRGGFETDAGLRLSFGIERATYINGNLVASSNVHIPDVSKLTAEQAQKLVAAVGTVNLVQNGPRNVFESNQSTQAAATVIQNTLNDQVIKNLTTLDTTTNSLQFLKNINSQSALRDALIAPIGNR